MRPHLELRISRSRALSVDAQTTTATAPPRVSYLQPPHAAANHDTSLPIEELQPEDPGRKSDHTLIDSKQSTDPTRRPPRAFPQKNSKAWTGPLHSNSHIKKPLTVSTSHRRVFSQHPHRAPRGRITLSLPPPPPFQSGHFRKLFLPP